MTGLAGVSAVVGLSYQTTCHSSTGKPPFFED